MIRQSDRHVEHARQRLNGAKVLAVSWCRIARDTVQQGDVTDTMNARRGDRVRGLGGGRQAGRDFWRHRGEGSPMPQKPRQNPLS